MIATATPADLRVDPRTAGRPVKGCELRILGDDGRELPAGEVGQIAVLNTTPFDGYTHGDHQGPPRRLHADRRPRPARRGRPAAGRGPGGRHDHQRRRERLPRRGGGRPRRTPDVVEAAVVGVPTRSSASGCWLRRAAPGADADPEALRTHVARPARQLQGAARDRRPRRAAAQRLGQGREAGATRDSSSSSRVRATSSAICLDQGVHALERDHAPDSAPTKETSTELAVQLEVGAVEHVGLHAGASRSPSKVGLVPTLIADGHGAAAGLVEPLVPAPAAHRRTPRPPGPPVPLWSGRWRSGSRARARAGRPRTTCPPTE